MPDTETTPTPAATATFLFDHMDILAHLFFAAGTADHVRMSWPQGQLEGTFSYPDGTRVHLSHSLHFTPPEVGSIVFVEYAGPSDKYRFFASVLDVFRGEVVLAFPESIECSDRRLTLRLHLSGNAKVVINVRSGDAFVPCKPVDLSDGGVGFLAFDGWPYADGEPFEAFLDIGEDSQLALRAEVRHSREVTDGLLIGGRFIAMSLTERARLARFLVSQEGVEADFA
jgi:hypothetical protein